MRVPRSAWLAGLLFTLAAHAAPPHPAPTPEALHAEKNSALIQQLLAERFTDRHDRTELQVAILRSSGTMRGEAEALERAEQRRLLHRITGEPYARPHTIGEAIASEAGAAAVDGKPALERVKIDFATPAAARALGVPAGAADAGPGIWMDGAARLAKVHVALTVHNGLALPIRETGFEFGRGADGKYLVSLTCPLSTNIAPGKEATALCTGMDRIERIGPVVQALAARTPPGPFTAGWVRSTEGSDLFGRMDMEVPGNGPHQQARETLASASCADKGTCAAIAKAEEDRRAAQWRAERPSIGVAIGAALALVFGIVAALRVREPAPGGWIVSALAVVATLYACFALFAAYIAVRPHAGYGAMAAFIVVYFGAVPFFAILAIVAGDSLRNGATRLGAFALAFGVVAALTVGGSLLVAS